VRKKVLNRARAGRRRASLEASRETSRGHESAFFWSGRSIGRLAGKDAAGFRARRDAVEFGGRRGVVEITGKVWEPMERYREGDGYAEWTAVRAALEA